VGGYGWPSVLVSPAGSWASGGFTWNGVRFPPDFPALAKLQALAQGVDHGST
jgi:hypothetical protein